MRLTDLLPMDILYAGSVRKPADGLDYLDGLIQAYLKKHPMMRRGLFDGKHTEHVLRMALSPKCWIVPFEDEQTKVRVVIASGKDDVQDLARLNSIINQHIHKVYKYTR